MLRRIEAEEGAGVAKSAAPPIPGDPIVAPVADVELESSSLPHGHPHWVRDAIALSQRARELLERLRPVAIRVLSLWDHRVRSTVVGDRRICVDSSGSYRAEP